jgi:hypothetical protein
MYNTGIDYEKEVEKFIQRLNDGMFIVTPKATELKYVFYPLATDYSFDRLKKTMTLGDCLTNSLNLFELSKSDKSLRLQYAILSYSYIRRAWLTGSIQESSGLTKKLEECKAKNTQLEKDLQILSVKYNELAKKHTEFTKHFAKLPPKRKGNENGQTA